MFGILTFHGWLQPIRIRTWGETDSNILPVLCRSCTGQSSYLSLNELGRFNGSRNETLLQSCNVFYASKNLYFVKVKLSCFPCFLTLYIFSSLVFQKFLKPKEHFTPTWIPLFLAISSVPINHKHWDATVFQIIHQNLPRSAHEHHCLSISQAYLVCVYEHV